MNPFRNIAIYVCIVLAGCGGDLGTDARFGMYAGKQPEPKPEPVFEVMSTKFETRWFPAHVRWAPDDSHLLVSLCHVNREDYCRIGKYWIAEKRWELLHLQPRITYRWPSYAPDGKHIVATAGACDENYRCPGSSYALILLTLDGKRTTRLAATYAKQPTFSDDGRKIIYWRFTGGGGAGVAVFDLDTGKEELLFDRFEWSSNVSGGAYFLPGGERFVFAVALDLMRPAGSEMLKKDGVILRDKDGLPLYEHPWNGTKLDWRGPNRGVIRYVWDRRLGPVTSENLLQVDLLWPDGGRSANNAGVEDVSRNGDVLYYCPTINCLYRKLDAGHPPITGIAPEQRPKKDQRVLALRSAREDAWDTAAFVFGASPQVAAISNDGRRVAFSEAGRAGWHLTYRFGIATLGNPNPEFIDWPRLDLDPASTQPIVTE